MQRTPVSSSCLASVGYEARRNILELEFVHGDVYRYWPVPVSLYHGLMSAASRGTFYQEQIRDAGFHYERLS